MGEIFSESEAQTKHNWPSLPEGGGRAFHGCALINKTHLIIAGGKDTGSNHLRSSWVLDMVNGVWSQTGDLQVRRGETVLTNVGGRVVAIAGYDNKEYWQQLEEFQPQLNRYIYSIYFYDSYLEIKVLKPSLLSIQGMLFVIRWRMLETSVKVKRRGHAMANVPAQWFDYFHGGCSP